VTMLIPDNRRDRANGLVGTASGISFLSSAERSWRSWTPMAYR